MDSSIIQKSQCAICFENFINSTDRLAPCGCLGSTKYVHRQCLEVWLIELNRQKRPMICRICGQAYRLNRFNVLNQCLPNHYRQLNDFEENAYYGLLTELLAKLLFITLLFYLIFFLILSGPLTVIINNGRVPDMDFLWSKPDAYVMACLDRDCQCRTGTYSNSNYPIWRHRCHFWTDKSVFIFSKIKFDLYDADSIIDDLVGETRWNIFVLMIYELFTDQIMLYRPHQASISVSINWKPNLFHYALTLTELILYLVPTIFITVSVFNQLVRWRLI